MEFTQRLGEIFGIELKDYFAKQTLDVMVQLAKQDDCRQVGYFAVALTAEDCLIDAERINKIFSWVCAHILFEKDPMVLWKGVPTPSEYIKTPCRMLAEIRKKGYTSGDCDDQAVFLAACFYALGLKPGFVAISNPGSERLDHVFAFASDRERKLLIAVDPQGDKYDLSAYRGKRMMTFL